MTIYILPINYPNPQSPTKDIFAYEQARALANLGHKIVVLHVHKQPTRKIFKKISRKIEKSDDGFAVRYTLNSHTFMEHKLTAANSRHFTKKMMRLFQHAVQREGMPDALYAFFSVSAGYAGAKIAQKYQVPLAVFEANGVIMKGPNEQYQKILRYTIDHADVFSCVSDNLRKQIHEILNLQKEIGVIPCMIDKAFTYHPPVEKDYVRFYALGNLFPGKRFELLVNAFVRAFAPDENVKLYISGKGERCEAIKAIISAAGREDQIIMLGSQSRDEILEQFSLCDCFVLPSAYETFGMVWREAMAVGRPIITTDHGGFDTWDEQWGIKIKVDDQDALVEALKTMKDTYGNYDGKYISESCLGLYGSNRVAKEVEESLNKAIESHKA